jgi:CheY-like chemotaxis protein
MAGMNKTILLADDDASIRRMVGRVLESEGYRVLYAATGTEAASQFLSGPPDLILLDLNMPERDGWEAWEIINTLHPMLPVIIITARPHQYRRANQLRIDALMEKPLDLSLLLDTIKRLLAEPDAERLMRVSAPDFHTACINPSTRFEDRPKDSDFP